MCQIRPRHLVLQKVLTGGKESFSKQHMLMYSLQLTVQYVFRDIWMNKFSALIPPEIIHVMPGALL